MKFVFAIFLFAFVTISRAEDFEDIFLDDGGEPNRHPYVQCKIDLYDCIRADEKSNWACAREYYTCMKQLIPTLPPMPTLPPSIQCAKDLFKCFKDNEVGNFKCVNEYGSCMNKQLPSFIQACNNDVMQCYSTASGLTDKLKCVKDFTYCFFNGPTAAPVPAVFDAMEDAGQMEDFNDVLQCKKDLYNCVKDGEKDKKVCFNDYYACLDALIPPYVKQCSATAKECYANASGIKAKIVCAKDLVICLKNGASTQAPPP